MPSTASVPCERRQAPRDRAIPNHATFERVHARDRPRARGRLIDVGQGGALVACDQALEVGEQLYMRLDHPVRTDWKGARVVRRGGPGELGIQFLGSAPMDIILAATLGIDLVRSLIDLPDDERFSQADD